MVEEAHRLGLPVAGHIARPEDRATALQAALVAGLDVIAHAEEIFFTYFHAGVDSLLDLGRVPSQNLLRTTFVGLDNLE